jgi:glycosyltransferase involved in cell wall biosynthesis
MHFIALEHEPSSLRGGQELNLFEICRGMSERGHQVSLLYEREGNLLEQYRQFCAHTIQVNGFGFDRRKFLDILNFLPSLASIPSLPVTQNSVVFSNDYHSAFFGRLLALYRKLPLICYFQIPPCDFNRQRSFGLKGASRFIAVSHQTKQNWAKLGYNNETIDIVYNGTNLERFKPAQDVTIVRQKWDIPDHANVISFVGRLDREKGLEVLLQAFSLLLKTGRTAELLIAGKPLVHISPEKNCECPETGKQYQRSLEELANKLGILDHVHFLGHVTNTPSLYQASDVTVVPSLWDEPFGRVIIEAMACGTPVVASKVGGIPEILNNEFSSHLIEPGNEQDLFQTLNQILDWRIHDPELGKRCREHILSQFSLEKMVDGIEQVLLKVVGNE